MFRNASVLKKTHDYCAEKEPRLTVVMIHGIAATSATYTSALKYLEGTTSLKPVRFVTFDLLGSGQSYAGDDLEYDYNEQLEALHNSITKLKIKTPLVLVGHSMGTFIVTRYADTYKKTVKELVLISPPVYTKDDLESPDFTLAMQMFEKAVAAKNREIVTERSFLNSVKYIVSNKTNYRVLANLKTPAVMIYGDQDPLVASFNYPTLLKDNPKYLTLIKTNGRHGVSQEKYRKLVPILEKLLND